MKKLIIFDMDGVMLDTEPIYIQAWIDTFSRHGVTLDDDLIHSFIGITGQQVESKLSPFVPQGETFTNIVNERDSLYWVIAEKEGVKIKEGTLELISELKELNIPIAIASSTNTDRAKYSQELANFNVEFDYEVYGDTVEHRKPAPDIFLKVLELAKIKPEEALILEDSYSGVMAANLAGIDCIWVKDIVELQDKDSLELIAEFDSLTDAHDFVINKII